MGFSWLKVASDGMLYEHDNQPLGSRSAVNTLKIRVATLYWSILLHIHTITILYLY